MSTSVFHRRRAERLAQLLDGASGTHDQQLAGYVRLSNALVRSAGVLPTPNPEFRASLRAQLVATAERDGIGVAALDEPESGGKRARTGPPLVTRGRAKGAILVGLAAGTLALSGMSAASGNAMPGDPLYSVKRSTESARLALAGTDVGRGQLYLEFARNRVAEAQTMGTRAQGLSAMLDDMDEESRDGVRLLTQAAIDRHDRTGLDLIDAFVPQQRADLTKLGDSARIRQSLALLDQIAARSAQLRPDLACGAGVGSTDSLGAVPRTCPTGTGKGAGPAPRPEVTGLPGGTAGAGGQSTGTTHPSPSSSGGLLGDLGRILGGH
jgi:uncharacterized protein DUF5667